ncbi:MAG TPA: HupE/UreJ family protein [Steroidobacteraceae bacterium]|nr:HupE/UreJ family protein [Steroidobacteraceae bacterium]
MKARDPGLVALMLLAAGMLLAGGSARAHTASNGFLTVHVDGAEIRGSVELAVRDVELAIGVDADGDGKVTWGELRAAQARLDRYVGDHLTLAARGRDCPLTLEPMRVNDRVDGSYAWLPFTARCAVEPAALTIRYGLMQGIDPSHRGLLALEAGGKTQTGVLAPDSSPLELSLTAPSAWRAATEYFRAGVWHIWSGIDHLLFLLSLLLPAVLIRRGGRWEPVPHARPALNNIVKVVTAFTVAHSITLTLAALDVVRLPTRLTESVIAASIIVAALNNIFPWVTESRARIAFAFGLLHGFGFASVLADMGLPRDARLVSLVSFNLGIEAGQLAVVMMVMPLVYGLRSAALYRRTLMPWGSAAIAALAFVWLVQRALLPVG